MRTFSQFLTAALLWTATSVQAQMANQGLLAYYPFSGNTLDASGNGHHLLNFGAVPAASQTGHSNAAYAFNGTGAYMVIPASPALDLNGNYSICLKVKPTGYYQGTCHANSLFSTGNDGNSGAVNIRFDDRLYTGNQHCSTPVVDTAHQNFYGFQSFGATTPDVPYPTYATQNTWHSLVFSQVGDSLTMYVNTTKIQTAFNPHNTALMPVDIWLGKLNSSRYPYYFTGVLDEVRIYGRGLSLEEIIHYHNYDPAPAPTAVAKTGVPAGIRVFPNPATTQLWIEKPAGQVVSYGLASVDGHLLEKGILAKDQSAISIAHLPAGLYFLQMQTDFIRETVRFLKHYE